MWEELTLKPILQVEDLTYIYSIGTPFEHKALDRVSFSINPGEFVGIIGNYLHCYFGVHYSPVRICSTQI